MGPSVRQSGCQCQTKIDDHASLQNPRIARDSGRLTFRTVRGARTHINTEMAQLIGDFLCRAPRPLTVVHRVSRGVMFEQSLNLCDYFRGVFFTLGRPAPACLRPSGRISLSII